MNMFLKPLPHAARGGVFFLAGSNRFFNAFNLSADNAEGSRCKAASLRPMGEKTIPPGLGGVIACDGFHSNW